MTKKIIIDANYPSETRVALLNDNNSIEAIEYDTANKHQIKGNIYLGKIVRIEPALQAAFVEYGSGRNGFLPFSEIHPDYYNIPVSDKEAKAPLATLHKMTPPEITSEDIAEKDSTKNSGEIEEGSLDPDMLQIKDDGDNGDDNEIESISGRDSDANAYRNYKIQDVIKKGQVILLQAQKEERGNKGASFTSYISLAGKYCVLMPNRPGHNGISRRIASLEERRRLREIVSSLTAEDSSNVSIIVRTAGIARTTYDIKRDYDYLARLWNRVREATIKATAPAFIHMEDGIILKTIRDMLDHNVGEILVQGANAHKDAAEFIQNIIPSEADKLKEYKNKVPIFTKFGIEEQLSSLYQPVVKLPSGGYIVINPTEALISIDVNSGKATSERNIEETAAKTNIEAAIEVARQLRLRDLSGLIVIDFIDMYETKNKRLVEKTLRQHLTRDRARIQTGNISPFGLLEMSRQRIRSSFLEANSKACHHCSGKGIVRADESNAMLILRTVENELLTGNADTVNIFAHLDVVLYLVNHKRKEIAAIESKQGIKLNFLHEPNATSDSFSMEKLKGTGKADDDSQYKQEAMLSSNELFEAEDAVLLSKVPLEAQKQREPQEQREPRQQKEGGRRSKWKNKKGQGDNSAPSEESQVAEGSEVKADPEAAAEPATTKEAAATKPPRKSKPARERAPAKAVAAEAVVVAAEAVPAKEENEEVAKPKSGRKAAPAKRRSSRPPRKDVAPKE